MQPFLLTIPTGDAHPVVADWYRPTLLDGGDVAHVIVMCHGFKGHRRWGFIPTVAARLCAAGFGALAIDFSHNGRIPADAGTAHTIGPDAAASTGRYVSPKLFRANTIARELTDLQGVIEWIRHPGHGGRALGIANDPAIGLWGHSRGGVVAILATLADPSISALTTWSASAHPDHFTDRQKQVWKEKGELSFTDYATGTRLAMGVALLDDIEEHSADYAVGERAVELVAPHLIVHGEHDPTVPVAESYRFYDTPTIRADKKLLRLLTGHTFAFEEGGESEALRNAIKATVEWFDAYLRAAPAH
jgi:dienelactone hydrolase